MNLTKHLYLAGFCSLLLCGCGTMQNKTELLAKPGMEKQSELFPGSTFKPYSKVIKSYGSSWQVVNPERNPVFFTVFQGQKLDPEGIYKLQLRVVGQEGSRILLTGSEYSKGKIIKGHILLNLVTLILLFMTYGFQLFCICFLQF